MKREQVKMVEATNRMNRIKDHKSVRMMIISDEHGKCLRRFPENVQNYK